MKQFTNTLLCKIVALSVTFFSIQSIFADKIKVEKLDDLPRYTYKLDITAVELYSDDKALSELTKQVKKDLLSDLDKYDISDSTTLQGYYANLGSIALIESDWEKYLVYLNLRKDLETKEANRLTKGLIANSVVKAKLKGGDDFATVFRDEYSKLIASLPYEVVQDSLKSTKGNAEILSTNLIIGLVKERIQPQLDKSNGEMSEVTARRLLGRVFTLKYFIPLKDIIQQELSKVIAANHIEKEDIWAARNQTLTINDGKKEVVLAVWDSGVDSKIFNKSNQMWTNAAEKPDNGIDDDNNGFIDDVHGIAFSLHADKESSLLYPIGDLINNEDELRNQNKGLIDIQASIDSEEAKALRKKLSSIKQDQVKQLIEDISIYGNYSHGTHVAGIAADGNPFARILGARLTFGHTMLPETPTIEQAKKDVLAMIATIEYFKANNVRAVNMSWGGSLAGIESALEANNAGGSAEERKKLSREIYNIGDKAFREAIQNAPKILFITSAGNSDNNVTFEEFYPSSYDYPNIISVGAVDQAGDETSFTSFGKVEVYGNGFKVESYVPGGHRIKYSGTSMSSPQVLNLVGKMLAINPSLTTIQLRQLVIDGADSKDTGDHTIALINPKKSIALAKKL